MMADSIQQDTATASSADREMWATIVRHLIGIVKAIAKAKGLTLPNF